MGLVTALPHQAFVFFPRPNCLFLYTLYISSMQYFSAFLSCLCSCVLISIPPHGATSPATLALHVLLCLLRPDWWTDSCLDSLSSVSLFTSCYCFVCHFQSFLFIYVPPPCDSCLCPPPLHFFPPLSAGTSFQFFLCCDVFCQSNIFLANIVIIWLGTWLEFFSSGDEKAAGYLQCTVIVMWCSDHQSDPHMVIEMVVKYHSQ